MTFGRGLCGLPIAVVTVLCAAPARAAAAEPSALAFRDVRAGVSLDGAWHVIVDSYDNDSTKKQAFDVLRDAHRSWPPLAPATAAGR